MRKLLLNQLNLIAREDLVMRFGAILAKISARKSDALAQTFVYPDIPFTQDGLSSAYSVFKNNSWINK